MRRPCSGSGLECREVLWGESWDGATQGDPESGPYFAAAIQKFGSMEGEVAQNLDGMMDICLVHQTWPYKLLSCSITK